MQSKTIKKTVKPQRKQKVKKVSDSEYSFAEKDLVSLPALDMNDSEENIVASIMKQLTEVGFLHLKNVPGFSEDRLLKDIKEFHALPDKIKREG